MNTQVFQTNLKLRGLLLILIFTFAASGIALAVLSQIQAYHREQIYLATEAGLPRHRGNITPAPDKSGAAPPILGGDEDIANWKTYRN